jgi:hypothetical protein
MSDQEELFQNLRPELRAEFFLIWGETALIQMLPHLPRQLQDDIQELKIFILVRQLIVIALFREEVPTPILQVITSSVPAHEAVIMFRIITSLLQEQTISQAAIKAHNGLLPYIQGLAAVPAATEATVQLPPITAAQVPVWIPPEAIHLPPEVVITAHPAAVTTQEAAEATLLPAEAVATTLPEAVEGAIHPEAAEAAALLQEEAHLQVVVREAVEEDNKFCV